MSILQALQKKRTETPNGEATNGAENVVPFNGIARQAFVPADLVSSSFTIGNPGSTFNGQPESNFGTALPDLETGITAGANLNVDSPTRSVVKPLPDFVSWQVDPSALSLV